MSNIGRASVASVPVASATSEQDGECVAERFLVRPVGTPTRKPFAHEDREALRRLCEAGKVIRRTCGNYGTRERTLMTRQVAARLKSRDLAVSGFNKEMVPTDKGIRLNKEAGNADHPAQ